MTTQENHRLGKTLWSIADQLRGAMDADDFRDSILALPSLLDWPEATS
ncbi:MAG TPA: type I restriction-modification system subunit M N-terminal domain-containing protein [Fimbriimonadaceae bacterium]|nr:type I restriction-modification system subunit M N-terminal domain-containing protein [Fimbriimonadaceae bacterium]